MKKSIYALAALLLSTSALADTAVSKPLVCREVGKRDAGYLVTFKDNRASALVKSVSFTGARVIGELRCHGDGKVDSTGAKTLYSCSDANLRDAGYSVKLVYTNKDNKPQLFAHLSEVSFVGAKLLTQLRCSSY